MNGKKSTINENCGSGFTILLDRFKQVHRCRGKNLYSDVHFDVKGDLEGAQRKACCL